MLEEPQQVLGVVTLAHYEGLQAHIITRNKQMRPQQAWRDPWESPAQPSVYVGAGRWLVRCTCGDCCSVSLAWRVAFCNGCGARYRTLAIPPNAADIDAILSARPSRMQMNWRPDETLVDLVREQLAHGDPVPAPYLELLPPEDRP